MNYYEDDIKFDIANKNTLIINLKHQLEKIKQNEKDYNELLNKCKNIENELQLMNEAKMKLDYELKQTTGNINKDKEEFSFQNNQLIERLNNINSNNKQLFSDNRNLFEKFEKVKEENEKIMNEYNKNENKINEIKEYNNKGEEYINNLYEKEKEEELKLKELNEQFEKLDKETREKGSLINTSKYEFGITQRELNTLCKENNYLKDKLTKKENNLDNTQSELDHANQSIIKFENDSKQIIIDNKKLKEDLINLRNDYEKERKKRLDAEKNNFNFEGILREKNDNVHKLKLINDSLKLNLDRENNINKRLIEDAEKYKNYCNLLSEQTKKLSDELEQIVEEDCNVIEIIDDQHERLCELVNEQKQTLNQEMDELSKFNIVCNQKMQNTYF